MRKTSSSSKRYGAKEVLNLGPKLSTATIFFHEAIATKLKLNATDMKCLTYISNSKGPLVAGDIATLTGLTTGAVTGVLNRLEEKKLISRVSDSTDRRKVFLQLNVDAFQKIKPLYSSMRKSVEALVNTYPDAELDTIAAFLEKVIEVLNRETHKLKG
ncbi:MAG: MarR family transcriptional regulator [Bdellovibrionota bacterium]